MMTESSLIDCTIADAKILLKEYIAADIPAFLIGASGLGKSDIVREIGADDSMPVIDYRATLVESCDVHGLPRISGDYVEWIPPGAFPRVERDGKRGLLLIDELNAAAPSVQTAFFQLILDRCIGDYKLPPEWRIVAAGNRQIDKASAQRMPSALANRFAFIHVIPDVDSWRSWADRKGLSAILSAFLAFRPELLHKMPEKDIYAFPSPRSWAQVAKVTGIANDTLRLRAIAGLVGDFAASEFEAFNRIWRELPSVAQVIANPMGAPVPREPSACFAIFMALARKADRQNFGAMVEYMSRLDSDYAAAFTTEAVRLKPELKETSAYVSSVVRHQGVQI